jgi:hypothetical protein
MKGYHYLMRLAHAMNALAQLCVGAVVRHVRLNFLPFDRWLGEPFRSPSRGE